MVIPLLQSGTAAVLISEVITQELWREKIRRGKEESAGWPPENYGCLCKSLCQWKLQQLDKSLCGVSVVPLIETQLRAKGTPFSSTSCFQKLQGMLCPSAWWGDGGKGVALLKA